MSLCTLVVWWWSYLSTEYRFWRCWGGKRHIAGWDVDAKFLAYLRTKEYRIETLLRFAVLVTLDWFGHPTMKLFWAPIRIQRLTPKRLAKFAVAALLWTCSSSPEGLSKWQTAFYGALHSSVASRIVFFSLGCPWPVFKLIWCDKHVILFAGRFPEHQSNTLTYIKGGIWPTCPKKLYNEIGNFWHQTDNQPGSPKRPVWQHYDDMVWHLSPDVIYVLSLG